MIKMYDVMGRLVKELVVTESGETTLPILVGSLEPGVYMIKLESSGMERSFRWVKR
jgi:hypothetical protein